MAARRGILDTLKGDVATVKHTLGRVNAPAVLVGDWFRRHPNYCSGNG